MLEDSMEPDFDALSPLEVPAFRPNIPLHLLSGLTPGERYQIETLSVVAQAVEWNTQQVMRLHRVSRLLYGRTAALTLLSKKWTWPVAAAAWLAPYWLPKLITHLTK